QVKQVRDVNQDLHCLLPSRGPGAAALEKSVETGAVADLKPAWEIVGGFVEGTMRGRSIEQRRCVAQIRRVEALREARDERAQCAFVLGPRLRVARRRDEGAERPQLGDP